MVTVNRKAPRYEVLTDSEERLVDRLRDEATALKDCFTRFSFQVTGFSILYLGVLARVQLTAPMLGLCSLPLIFVLRIVTRVGVHKYGSANRNLGYELHLHRTLNVPEQLPDGWRKEYRSIGWEQAMRAWRVIQATVFEHLGLHRGSGVDPTDSSSRWYLPSSLVLDGTTYYAGSYVRKVVKSLHALMFLALVPTGIALGYSVIRLRSSVGPLLNDGWLWLCLLSLGLFLVGLVGIWRVCRDDRVRVEMLEGGLLSIHSCGIMWQAVVVGHYRALESALTVNGGHSPKGYTYYLSHQAKGICARLDSIYEWIDGSTSRAFPRVPVDFKASVEIDGLGCISGRVSDYSFDGGGVGFVPDETPLIGSGSELPKHVTLRIADCEESGYLVIRQEEQAEQRGSRTLGRFGLRIDGAGARFSIKRVLEAQAGEDHDN